MNIDELKKVAADARESIWADAKRYGRDPKIYLHWSAGHYGTAFDDYHINIDQDGSFECGDLTEIKSCTFKRNTGSVGVSLECCAFAETENLGEEPPTTQQIETMAQVVAVLCHELWLTIDKEHVMTHGEAGDNEDGLSPHTPYGPKSTCERWDLEVLGTPECPTFNPYNEGSRGGDILRGKANFYAKTLYPEDKQ